MSLRKKKVFFYNYSFCYLSDEQYEKENGWLEILDPLLTLDIKRNEIYNLFSAIINRYIPR